MLPEHIEEINSLKTAQAEEKVRALHKKIKPDAPDWVKEEIIATWNAARNSGSQTEAFRILERMVDRIGYGRIENNPPLIPAH